MLIHETNCFLLLNNKLTLLEVLAVLWGMRLVVLRAAKEVFFLKDEGSMFIRNAGICTA
jgi:hypothetical protein